MNQCDQCDQSFDSKRGLRIHQTHVHEYNDSADCPECGRTFDSEQGLKVHYGRSHEGSLAGVKVECSICGETRKLPRHEAEARDHHFCSPEHERQWRRERYSGEANPNYVSKRAKVTCEHCGQTETVAPWRSDSYRFCSIECKAEWQSEHRSGEDAYAYENGSPKWECEQCGSEFHSYMPNARFCSRECTAEWKEIAYSGSGNPSFTDARVEQTCDWCGNAYTVTAAKAEESRYCSVNCLAEYRKTITGQNHHSWRGGSNIRVAVKQQLPGKSWEARREDQREERCQLCGTDGGDETLHVHHIISIIDGGTNEPWNLMTLCNVCHNTVEAYTRKYTRPVLLPE